MTNIRLPGIEYGDSVFDAGVKGLRQGQDEFDRTTLFDIGKMALKGDWQGAQNKAFERGNLDAGFKIKGDQQQTADRARELERKVATDAAGIFQNFIDKEADPAKKSALTQQFIQAHPEMGPRLQRYGVNLQDPTAVSGFFQAQARGYQDPVQSQKDQLGLELTRAQINAANQRADQSKVLETSDGRVLRVPQQGPAEEVYKGAGGKVPDSVRSDGIKAQQAYDNLIPALDNFRTLIGKTGVVALPGKDKDAVIQARRNIQLQLKELYNLGVLNGPDLELMDRMVFDPSVNILNPFDYTNAYDTAKRGEQSVDQLKDMLRNIRNNKTKALGVPEIPSDLPDRTNGKGSDAQGQIPPDAVRALQQNPALAPQFEAKYRVPANQFLGR